MATSPIPPPQTDLSKIPSQHTIHINTLRLHLRPVHPPTDLQKIHRIRLNPRVMEYMNTGVETNPDPMACHSLSRIQMMTTPDFLSFAIDVLPTDTSVTTSSSPPPSTTIGFIGVTRPTELFYILDSPYWGHGYATEAIGAFLPVYFAHCPRGVPGSTDEERDLLYAFVLEGNQASERVAEKAGFELVRREGGTGEERGEAVFVVRRPS